METGRIVTIAAASIGVLTLVGAVLIKRQLDAVNAEESRLNSLNADREPLFTEHGWAPSTPEERARLQAELDAKNAEIDAKKAKMDAGLKDAQTLKSRCHMLDGTPVRACALGDSMCVCDAPPDR